MTTFASEIERAAWVQFAAGAMASGSVDAAKHADDMLAELRERSAVLDAPRIAQEAKLEAKREKLAGAVPNFGMRAKGDEEQPAEETASAEPTP